MNFNSATCLSLLTDQLGTNTMITCDMTSKQAASASLVASFLKKWKPADPSVLENVAIDSFKRSNQHCREVVLPQASEYIYDVLELAKASLARMFYSGPLQTCVLTSSAILDEGRAGPGASVKANFNDFYGKMFESPLSMTHTGLYEYFVRNISPTWFEADCCRHKNFGEVVVEGSNLTTVPKNGTTNRTICTEPSLNMFYQLGAGAVLGRLVKRYHNIDFATQPDVNKAMARTGSIDGRFATIDLTNASDTVSLTLTRYLLPRRVEGLLESLRSPRTKIAGEYVELYMMSSMGNGFTFPLQTLIFATLVRSAYEFLGIRPIARGPNRNYAVFGDDIICLSQVYEFVVKVLHGCGFLVNEQKSFAGGPFRESCGGDYFKGVDVRGVYLKEIRNAQDLYSVFNRLARWSVKHCIDISRCLLYIKQQVRFQPVPFDAGDVEGIKCPQSQLTHSKFDRNGARIYWASSPRVRRREVSEANIAYNPAGALIAHIGGYLQGHQATLRTDVPSWKVVRRKTPSWDFIPHPGSTIRDYEYLWLKLSLCD